jgi:hypothetical protein
MTMPRFTAETALYKTSRQYRAVGVPDASPSGWVIPMQVAALGIGGGSSSFECNSTFCTCSGDRDCNDMFGSGVCGDDAICDEDGCVCIRSFTYGRPRFPGSRPRFPGSVFGGGLSILTR